MITYGRTIVDIDLGIGREHGYRDPRHAALIEDMRPEPTGRRAPTCHPDRRHKAHGLCAACYHTRRRSKR